MNQIVGSPGKLSARAVPAQVLRLRTVLGAAARFVRKRTMSEQAMVGLAVLLLALMMFSVRVAGVQRSLELARRIRPSLSGSGNDAAVHTVVTDVDYIARLLKRPSCLHRTLAVGASLRLFGHDVGLKVGVRRSAGVFDGHAWIELAGRPVGADGASALSYSPFAAIQDAGRR